jgi:hypothetical protein
MIDKALAVAIDKQRAVKRRAVLDHLTESYAAMEAIARRLDEARREHAASYISERVRRELSRDLS